MATRQPKVKVEKATNTNLNVNFNNTPERFRLGEMGFLGLNMFSGVSQEELKRELNWPHSIRIYKQMTYSPSINSALTLYENIVVWILSTRKGIP